MQHQQNGAGLPAGVDSQVVANVPYGTFATLSAGRAATAPAEEDISIVLLV